MTKRKGLQFAALLSALALIVAACGGDEGGGGGEGETYTIGVSNTLVGNGWREQMICSIKAQATASGVVDEVVVINENADMTGQIGHIENLISQGVDAIIINPTDREGLNSVIEEAINQGIVVVAVDQAVTAEGAYVATNDQVEYGYLGAKWLFEQLGGEGDVVYMRGIDGVPADSDRDEGFQRALEEFPGINVVQETFTGWDPSVGAEQALNIITTQEVDGIWTSGIDYTVVEQFQSADVPYVPIVGADNNGFIEQLIELEGDGLTGAAVTNPPAIGAVGTAIAIDALQGDSPGQSTILTPEVFDSSEQDQLDELYAPDEQVGWSTYTNIEPYTTYEAGAVSECTGPGESGS
ncbi:MAG TPA: ABC transporter substrate-binding protein [Acidimicrobiia bacterium]|nr:ABC transporter substrate-binding protein [Acidimicrobiia bacterium]HXV71088.1 ABC transporter substrate-binding protein [Acidimicrobiia bacterium]